MQQSGGLVFSKRNSPTKTKLEKIVEGNPLAEIEFNENLDNLLKQSRGLILDSNYRREETPQPKLIPTEINHLVV